MISDDSSRSAVLPVDICITGLSSNAKYFTRNRECSVIKQQWSEAVQRTARTLSSLKLTIKVPVTLCACVCVCVCVCVKCILSK